MHYGRQGRSHARLSAPLLAIAMFTMAGCHDESRMSVEPEPTTSIQLSMPGRRPAAALTASGDTIYSVSSNTTGYSYSARTGFLTVNKLGSVFKMEVPVSLARQLLSGLADLESGEAHEQAFARTNFVPPCGNGDFSGCEMRASSPLGSRAVVQAGGRVLLRRANPLALTTQPGSPHASLSDDDKCRDIGQAISNHRFRWAQKMIQTDDKFEALKNLGSVDIADGVLTLKGPEVAAVIVDAIVKAAENWSTNIEAAILTAEWNGNQCFGRQITVGPLNTPVNWGGSHGGGNPLVFHCEMEVWEISYNGGQTWHTISVRVCGFRPME